VWHAWRPRNHCGRGADVVSLSAGRDSPLRGLAVGIVGIAGAAEGLARSGGLRRLGSVWDLAGRRQAGTKGHSGPVNVVDVGCASSLLAGDGAMDSVGLDHAAGRLVASGSALGPARGAWVSACASGAKRWRRAQPGRVAGLVGTMLASWVRPPLQISQWLPASRVALPEPVERSSRAWRRSAVGGAPWVSAIGGSRVKWCRVPWRGFGAEREGRRPPYV